MSYIPLDMVSFSFSFSLAQTLANAMESHPVRQNISESHIVCSYKTKLYDQELQ